MRNYIIIGLIVLLVVGVGVVLIFQKNPTAQPPTSGGTGTLPVVNSSTTVFPTGTTMTIGTPQGSVVVNNIYINPSYITSDKETVVFKAASAYNLVYNVNDSTFEIALLAKPLDAARAAAEAALLSRLNISKSDACKLNVWEAVPVSVDPNYAGQNLGLSFCSSAFPLY